MKLKPDWTDRWIMLMACGSPGSALAYYRLQADKEPAMVRRTMAPDALSRSTTGGGE
jgi:hypothetical protein